MNTAIAAITELRTAEHAPEEMLEAFARFVQIDVANGDATADTVSAYHREMNAWVAWCREQNFDPMSAQRKHIEAYREALKAAGASVATRRHKLSIVRRFYAAMVKNGLATANPADGVKGGKDLTPPEEKMKSLTEGALGTLVRAIPTETLTGKRDRAIVGLMALHGLRRVEVHRLDHSSLLSEGDTPYLMVEGKGNKRRRVYLRRDTYDAIVAYKEAKAAAGLPVEGAIFLAHSIYKHGHRLSRRSLNAVVDRYLDATALKRLGVSCHALRHTFGTLSVAGGAKVEHVKDALGHSKLETTGIYVKAVERAKHNPAHCIGVDLKGY